MKQLIPLILLLIPFHINAQDCTGKIKSAQASKLAGNYRLALAQFTAAASSCNEDRRLEIENEILDIYDRIEKLKDDAVSAQKIAKVETENAKASEKKAAKALEEAQAASRTAQAALDSLKIVLLNLDKANADKVRLILAEVERYQQELNFETAIDKIKTASILHALPDSVHKAYQSLCRAILKNTRDDLLKKNYKSALTKIQWAEDLAVIPDEVAASKKSLEHFLFENASEDIRNANFDAALDKINTVNMLQVPLDTVGSLYFEIGFWFLEAEKPDRALGIFDTVAQLRNNDVARAQLRDMGNKAPAQQKRLLRETRSQLDPIRNQRLTAKYFSPTAVKIPEGVLMIENDPSDAAQKACNIPLKPFLLSEKEVTFFEYDLFCAATKRRKPTDSGYGRGDRPVIDVDWYDAIEYCNWRSRQDGLEEAYTISNKESNGRGVTCNWTANGYRLPSEAEWEFAGGNGEKSTRYAWGNDPPSTQKGGNVTDEMAKTKFPDWEIFKGYSDGFAYTAPTGSYPSSDFGLYDMTGNAWEWCWDRYDDNFCRSAKSRNLPQSSAASTDRVLRGGSWASFPKDSQVNSRFYLNPQARNNSIGFRLARN